MSRLRDRYSPEVIALWSDADKAAVRRWKEQKIANFEAGGTMATTHVSREALDEWMEEKVYGLGGTMDKALKMRSNPRVFLDVEADERALGRIIFQLRADVVPKTVQVCTHSMRTPHDVSSAPLTTPLPSLESEFPRALHRREWHPAALQGVSLSPCGPRVHLRGRRSPRLLRQRTVCG